MVQLTEQQIEAQIEQAIALLLMIWEKGFILKLLTVGYQPE